MNGFKEETPYCCFHPKEVIVGICALCLKERLLMLASKQGEVTLAPGDKKHNNKSFRILRRTPINTLNRVFALGSFLHLLEFRHHRKPSESCSHDDDDEEDSFISMKFEDNGRALWDDKKEEGAEPINCSSKCNKSPMKKEGEVGKRAVVEHSMPHGSLRWQKAIGRLLHVARWNRPTKAGACHVGLGGKVERRRRSWLISLTRRRTAAAAAATATSIN